MSPAVRILAAIGGSNALLAGTMFGLAAAGPRLREGLGVGESQLGLLLAAMPAGLMFGTFAWGVLSDRIGERRTLVLAWSIVAGALVAAAGVAQHAWDSSPGTSELTLLAATFLVAGWAGSAAHSAGGRAITEAFPEHLHGRVLSIRHTFIPIGGTVGGVGVPWVLHHLGLAELLLAIAVAAVGATAGMRLALPADPRSEPDMVDLAVDAASDGEVVVAPDRGPATGPSPLAVPDLWLLSGSCAMFAIVQLGLVSFLTIHLADVAGFGVAAASTIFAVAQLVGAFGRITLGDVSDRVGDPIAVLLVLAAVGVAVGTGALLAPDRVEGILLAVLLLLTTSWNGVAVAAAARLAPAGRMGATLGMQTTVNGAMGVVAPIGVGAMLAWSGWRPVEIAALVALAIALAGFAVLRPRIQAPGRVQHEASMVR